MTPGTPARSGLLLAANVLGVGALFLPWTARAAHGGAALWGWGYQVVAGALLVAALTAVSKAPGAEGGGTSLIGRALGQPYGRAIRVCYVLGVTAGQVVVALVAAGFLHQVAGPAAGGSGTWGGVGWMAAAVLAAGVVLTPFSRGVPGVLLFALVVLALPAAVLLGGEAGAGPQGAPAAAAASPVPVGDVGRAAALQFFVVVGWESASRLAPTTGRRRLLGPLSGVALVGLLYAAVLLATPHLGTEQVAGALALPDLGGSAAGRAVAGALGLLAAYFCVRNIRTAALLAAGLLAEARGGASGRASGGTSGRASGGTSGGREDRRHATGEATREGGQDGQAANGQAANGPAAAAPAASAPAAGAALAAAGPGAVAVAGVALVLAGRLTPTDVLAVPNSMAWAVFVTAAVAAAAAGRGRRRGLAVVAAAAYLPLAPFLGLPVLVPLVILAGSALWNALSRSRRTGGPVPQDAA
jgi:hypothetical protein